MNGPSSENLHLQLVPVDHESLFSVVLYAYERVVKKGADRAILHRAVLSPDFKADPDEVNRLRMLQRRLRELGGEEAEAEVEVLESRIAQEHGEGRTAAHLASVSLEEVRDAGVRWTAVGKRGEPVRISPELMGLLGRLYPDDVSEDGFPGFLEGNDTPVDGTGRAVFPDCASETGRPYRGVESVLEAYKALSFVDRDRLESAINVVIGEGPDREETATWLEADFERLCARYELAAAKRLGLHFRYS